MWRPLFGRIGSLKIYHSPGAQITRDARTELMREYAEKLGKRTYRRSRRVPQKVGLDVCKQFLQGLETHRLREMMVETAGFRLPPVFLLAPSGQGHQLDIVELGLPADLACHFMPTHARHANIHQYHLRFELGDCCKRRGAAVHRLGIY